MDKLYDLKDRLCEELEEIACKPDMGPGDLELIHKLTDTIKNSGKIEMLEEDGGYGEGISYARGRGRNNRRDSRGRYSQNNSRSKMMDHIEAALDTTNDKDREAIRRFMRQLENAHVCTKSKGNRVGDFWKESI